MKSQKIRRQLAKAAKSESAGPLSTAAGEGGDGKLGSAHDNMGPSHAHANTLPMPSPFHASGNFAAAFSVDKLPTLAEDQEAGDLGLQASSRVVLLTPETITSCRSSTLRQRPMSVRGSGMLTVVNSAPIPDLLPPGGERAFVIRSSEPCCRFVFEYCLN